jgi:hypothetical protein
MVLSVGGSEAVAACRRVGNRFCLAAAARRFLVQEREVLLACARGLKDNAEWFEAKPGRRMYLDGGTSGG